MKGRREVEERRSPSPLNDDIDEAIGDLPYELLIKADKKSEPRVKREEKKKPLQHKRKREDDDAPRERDAKKPPSNGAKVIFQTKRVEGIDPRFMGEPMDDFQKSKFYENYNFITDLKERENKLMSRESRKLKRHGKLEEAQFYRDEQGKNKSFIKSFNSQKQIVQARRDVRDEVKAEGARIPTSQLKQRFAERVRELKSKK